MTDPNFRNFMYSVVLVLEPDYCNKRTIMLNELDEVHQITFVHKGDVGVGYELNKFNKIVLRFCSKCVIGAFYATYNMRANFLYYAITNIESYFIRRNVWVGILEENYLVTDDMKRRIREHYFFKMKFRL